MDIFEELVRLRNLGQKCALATIVEVRGSIPSFESAKILVREDGSMTGTIGGGYVDVGDVKTEYSRDAVPLDQELAKVLLEHRARAPLNTAGWMFANPATGKPYHQEQIQKTHIRDAAKSAGLGIKAGPAIKVGWHMFRHSYRSWLDDTQAPMGVQKELMRHASIQTTMNVYGKAMSDTKRDANTKVVAQIFAKPLQNNHGKASKAA
jgi:integrase